MSSDILAIVSILLLPVIFSGIQQFRSLPSSDHFLHLTLVEQIRTNGHRFLLRRENYLYNPEMIYPQLMHWILSFLPTRVVKRCARPIMLAVSLLSSAAFVVFALCVFDDLPDTETSKSSFLWLSGLVFVMTPYSYHLANARSRGLSARGFGLLIGQSYLYCLVLYYLDGHPLLLAGAIALAAAAYMSSQFAMQAIVFSAPLLALLYADFWPLVLPVAGLGVFFLVAPRVAWIYVVGQVKHKVCYARHIAPTSTLKKRYSIWRDFVWDFWIGLHSALSSPKKKSALMRWLFYGWSNSIVILFAGFPFVMFVLIYAGVRGIDIASPDWGLGEVRFTLLAPVAASSLVFFLTTFRATRFVGQPERYLEFAIGPAAVLIPTFVTTHPVLVNCLLVFCFVMIFLQMYAFIKSVQNRMDIFGYYENIARLRHELEKLETMTGAETRLLANERTLMRCLMTADRKVFHGSRYDDRVGNMRMIEAFPSKNGVLTETALSIIIRDFEINTVALNIDHVADLSSLLSDDELSFTEIASIDNLRLYRVSSEESQSTGFRSSNSGNHDRQTSGHAVPVAQGGKPI